jgi:hypothetical protein
LRAFKFGPCNNVEFLFGVGFKTCIADIRGFNLEAV